jgi:cytochrome c oxidase subunit 2
MQASFWFPAQASANAANTDRVFYGILALSVVMFVLIVALMGVFVAAYRRREPKQKPSASAAHHNMRLELFWTIVPTILVVFIFYAGVQDYVAARTPYQSGYEIQVTGQKWKWMFTYANGYNSTEELHVPVGEHVRLLMRSEDVIHSLFIPAFRMKMDVVPGRYSQMSFVPTQVGTYPIFCAEYCGDNHSGMLAKLVVEPLDQYQKWLIEAENAEAKLDPVAVGKAAYQKWGCGQCHSIDGSKGIGPTFKNLWQRQEKFADGSSLVVDENYIHESIIEPMAKVVAGYAPVMPTFKGKIKDAEIHGIIEWLKTLHD